MLKHNHFAIAALDADKINNGVTGCFDMSADRRAIIDTLVRAPLLQDGMEACERKAGRDARKLQRRTQEGLVQALAFRCVVTTLAVTCIEPHSLDAVSIINEFSGENPAATQGFA